MDNSAASSDADLQALISGGADTLAELFSNHRERLERIVHFRLDHRLRRRIDSADVLQEAYIEISRRIGEFLERPTVSLFVWMRQQTLQVLIDLQREHFRNKRDIARENRMRASEPGGHSTSLSLAQYLADDHTSPSQAAVKAEEIQALTVAFDTMHEMDREVLALRHFEQLSNLQVAEILNLSPTAASNRYVRAAARLSEILKGRQPNRNIP